MEENSVQREKEGECFSQNSTHCVCWINNLWCEMCLLGRSLFDEMNCVDLISANA